jgi:hypothetical protein
VVDEFRYDLVELPGVSVEETVFEPLSREIDSEESAKTTDSEGTDSEGTEKA